MKISLFPLDLVLFPGAPLPLHIFEERYKEMIGECIRDKAEFGIARASRDRLAAVGCSAEILTVLHSYPDGRMDILCRGQRRFAIEALHDDRSFFEADIAWLGEEEQMSTRNEREGCAALHMEMLELSGGEPRNFPVLDLDRPVAFLLAAQIPADLEIKQQFLQMQSDSERTQRLAEFYETILPKLRRGAMARPFTQNDGFIM